MAKEIANNISHYTNAEKVKLVHDYLIIKNSYNVDKGGPFYGLFGGETNCSGYTCAFMIIMDECGIPCTIEVADEHAWNMVFIDGSWYNVDVTWDDNVSDIEQFAKISYMFFMKAADEWEGHSINNATAKEAYDINESFGKDVVGELLELNVA